MNDQLVRRLGGDAPMVPKEGGRLEPQAVDIWDDAIGREAPRREGPRPATASISTVEQAGAKDRSKGFAPGDRVLEGWRSRNDAIARVQHHARLGRRRGRTETGGEERCRDRFDHTFHVPVTLRPPTIGPSPR